MYRIFIIFILTLFSYIYTGSVFADGCNIQIDPPTTSELRGAVERCEKERDGGNPNSITEFVCPQGDFFAENNQPINHDTLPYIISVSVTFNKTDRAIKEYMLKLSKTRNPDPSEWVENIRSCKESIKNIYDTICQFGTLETILNGKSPEKPIITSTNTYPQDLCMKRAAAKTQGWYYLATIIMSDSLSKNQQNSTDTWVSRIKGAYGKILGSWQGYQKILSRAVSKMTGYTKESN